MGMPIKKLTETLREAIIDDDRRRAPVKDAADFERQEYERCRAMHATAVALAYRHDLAPPLFSQVRQDRISASGHFAFADNWAILMARRFRNAPLDMSHDPDREKGLDRFEEDAEAIADAHEIYAHGRCHLLAIALHRMTGLALEASLVADPCLDGQMHLEHAWVSWDERFALDIHGLIDKRALSTHYVDLNPDEVTQADETLLIRLGEGDDAAPADIARMLSQAVPAALDALSLAARMARASGIALPDGVLRSLFVAEHANERIGVSAITDAKNLAHEACA